MIDFKNFLKSVNEKNGLNFSDVSVKSAYVHFIRSLPDSNKISFQLSSAAKNKIPLKYIEVLS